MARPTVWVVDDSPLDARKAEKALSEWCAVEVFIDGSVVLEHLSSRPPPDVLVLDWVMPGISGIEVVQFLRSEKSRMSQVPVLLLTAQHQPSQIVEGLSAGANDYLPKPYAPEELRARAQALVRSAELLERAATAEKAVRDLLANSPDGFFAIDPEGIITYANQEAGRIFDVPVSSLIGSDVRKLLPTLPLHAVRRVTGQSAPPLPDIALGQRVYAPSIRLAAADPRASTTISLRDETERRRADRRRLDFYSIIAHDLRSPLTAMLLRADILLAGKRGPLSADATDDIRRFSGNIRAMVGMINGFLDLARLEDLSHKFDAVEVDLGALISTTVDELRPLAESKLSLEWSPPSTAVKVLGDKIRLGQVLSNLIGNAIKYTAAGGKVVVATSVGDSFIETSIADNGPGIPAESIPTLFERFTRVAATSHKLGTGLGLMIVKEVVEAHAGQVGVETVLGQGSTFWFRLPRLDVRPPGGSASA
jgi:signal transduction histidine kinase